MWTIYRDHINNFVYDNTLKKRQKFKVRKFLQLTPRFYFSKQGRQDNQFYHSTDLYYKIYTVLNNPWYDAAEFASVGKEEAYFHKDAEVVVKDQPN